MPEDDVAFLDTYAHERGLASRSAALHEAVRLLRAAELAPEYAAAWEEWRAGGGEAAWEAASADGLVDGDAPR